MPATQTFTKTPSSRLGNRNYKVPPPLRFATIKDAKKHIKANKLKVKEHHTNRRGHRIQVIDPQTKKVRTISVPVNKDEN